MEFHIWIIGGFVTILSWYIIWRMFEKKDK